MDKKELMELKKCRTPQCRLAFAEIWQPKSFKGQEAKYGVTMLFDKSKYPEKKDLKEIVRALSAAKKEVFGADPKSWPKDLRSPIRDGDGKGDWDGFKGNWFIRATSKLPPQIVGPDKTPLSDPKTVYSGCYGVVLLTAFAYKNNPGNGASFMLRAIQKAADGKPFGGSTNVDKEFDALEDTGGDIVEDNGNSSDDDF